MIEEHKYNFCVIFSCICVLLCFITLLVTTLTITELQSDLNTIESKYTRAKDDVTEILEKQYHLIADQNKKIEDYKLHCENITSKVINGEW